MTRFADDVIANRVIACRFVCLAAERHLRDLRDGPKRGLHWHVPSARYPVQFMERYLRHSKGELAGKPLLLEPWQKFRIGSMFGWKNANGLRRFQTSFSEVPKKNGKSTEAAGVGLIGLLADNEPGAEVYTVATKRDQARIVFGEARSMVRKSPALARLVKVFQLNLSVARTGSKFEPLSSDEKSADGLNPSHVVVDELHRHRSRALRNLMDSGTASRRQPLIFIITTAGDEDPISPYAIEHDYAVKVLEGVIEDDSYFAFIACADNPEKWDDPGEWAKANPNLGVSVKLDFLKRMAAKAKASPVDLADFKRFHINIRTSDSTRAIDMDVWAKNQRGPIDVERLKGRSCFLAVDLSSRQDITAAVKLFPPVEGDERWTIVPRFWTPLDTLDKRAERDQALYRLWRDQGYLTGTPGNVIDHASVKESILEDARLYRIEQIPYDPWNAMQLAIELQGVGLPVVEFVQGIKSYSSPTKLFLAMLLDAAFDHGANPVLKWMAHNLHVDSDKNENKMPNKARSTGRIDGITSVIMALGLATGPREDPNALDRAIKARGGFA